MLLPRANRQARAPLALRAAWCCCAAGALLATAGCGQTVRVLLPVPDGSFDFAVVAVVGVEGEDLYPVLGHSQLLPVVDTPASLSLSGLREDDELRVAVFLFREALLAASVGVPPAMLPERVRVTTTVEGDGIVPMPPREPSAGDWLTPVFGVGGDPMPSLELVTPGTVGEVVISAAAGQLRLQVILPGSDAAPMGTDAVVGTDSSIPPGTDAAALDSGPPPGTDSGPPSGTDSGPPPGTDSGPPPGTDSGPPPGTDAGPVCTPSCGSWGICVADNVCDCDGQPDGSSCGTIAGGRCCGGVCTNVWLDPSNCGGCGIVCPSGSCGMHFGGSPANNRGACNDCTAGGCPPGFTCRFPGNSGGICDCFGGGACAPYQFCGGDGAGGGLDACQP